MLSKRHAAALALLATLVAPGSFATPAAAQEYPRVTVLRTETVYRMPGHNPPVGEVRKGEQVTLRECTDSGSHCRIIVHAPGHRFSGWVTAAALDGVVTTK